MAPSVYRGRKAIIKQTEETMKTDIVAPPLILHRTYDNYLSAVVTSLISHNSFYYGTWTHK